MRKFGFGKKRADGDDDANRQALFGKKGSPAPASENPYAQSQPANDPYMNDNNKYANVTPYQQARARLGDPQANGLPSRPSPQNSYTSPPHTNTGDSGYSSASTANQYSANGFANEKYGTPSGYGVSKYNNSSSYGARPGGYGGLGQNDSNGTDVNRDQLFSGARERYDHQANRQANQQASQQNGAYGASGTDANASKYGGYGEQRELTEEEQEEAEVDEIKRQIKQEKLATAQTAANGARIAAQTVDVAMNMAARLGHQTERLVHTEQLIDKGSVASRDAEQGTKKLKSLNRSMFAVHVKSPFSGSRRERELEQQALSEHRADRELRETTRKEGYLGNQRMEAVFREAESSRKTNGFSRPSAAEKSKYAFEEEDDETVQADEATEHYVDEMYQSASTLNVIARGVGKELDTQNTMIDRIGAKSDQLSDKTAVNTRRLQTIR